jgi:ATP-dependent DNA helicase PIF1
MDPNDQEKYNSSLIMQIKQNDDFKITNEMIAQLEEIILNKLKLDMRKKYKPLLRKYIKTIEIDHKIYDANGSDEIESKFEEAQLQGFEGTLTEFKEHHDDNENILFEDLELSKEQSDAYRAVADGKSIMITGSAGVGKSLTLRAIIDFIQRNYKSSEFGVTSTTGCSALLIKGSTLHSFLKVGLAKESAKHLFNKLSDFSRKRLKQLRILIIDELSMMDRDLFEKISEYLKYVKGLNKPFGGIQLILSFDMAQLPPVNKSGYCFESEIWNELKLRCFNFTKSFRQEDTHFVDILNKLRFGHCTEEIFMELKELLFTEYDDETIEPMKLFSTNRMVESVNNKKLEILSKTSKLHKFPIIPISNNKKLIETESKRANISDDLTLCIGAQIMVSYNIYPKDSVVNGTMGVIKEINKIDNSYNVVIYVYSTKNEHVIPYIPFEYQEFDRSNNLKTKIIFNYLPLRVAYATSIHRSQGQTIDYAEMDLGSSVFAYGQGYTAISRCKKMENIKLLDIDADSFKCDPKVIKFYKDLGVDTD